MSLGFVLERCRQRWVDKTIFVHGKQNGTIESMMCGKNLCQHRHRLFAAVFLLSRDQHHVLSFSRQIAVAVALEMQPLFGLIFLFYLCCLRLAGLGDFVQCVIGVCMKQLVLVTGPHVRQKEVMNVSLHQSIHLDHNAHSVISYCNRRCCWLSLIHLGATVGLSVHMRKSLQPIGFRPRGDFTINGFGE